MHLNKINGADRLLIRQHHSRTFLKALARANQMRWISALPPVRTLIKKRQVDDSSWHTHQKTTKTAIVLVISRLDDYLLPSQVHVTRKLPFCWMLRVCAWLVLTIVSLTPG